MNIKTANRLCELRKKHNLSQEELAGMLGVSRQAVSKWERESSPDTDNLIELAKIYNITLDELLNGEEAIKLINENKQSISNENLIDATKSEKDKKHITIVNSITASSAAIATTIYIILGLSLNNNDGWKYFWFLFILIPVIPSIYTMFYKRKITLFCYPLVIAAAYCGFSMYYDIWNKLWLLFLTIPLFYIIFEPIDQLISKKDKK